jgi:hypothetical protein
MIRCISDLSEAKVIRPKNLAFIFIMEDRDFPLRPSQSCKLNRNLEISS